MLTDRLTEIMDSDRPHPFCSLATVLRCLSMGYGTVMEQRRKLYEKGVLASFQLPCTVISVGNLAVGGAGKTPMVIHLAEEIQRLGYAVAILSRGYKGTAEKQGAIVSDGCNLLCDAAQAGDEPYLMASLLEGVPVVVGKDRYAAGTTVVSRYNPDVILLDDAFQHLRLKRDLNLLLLDAQQPLGNTFLLPRGRLREPISAMARADAVVLTRSGQSTKAHLPFDGPHGKRQLPVFRSQHAGLVRAMAMAHKPMPPLGPAPPAAQSLDGRKVFAFAGLANNGAFFQTVADLGGKVVGSLEFADHHAYNTGEIVRIARRATAAGADCLATTDKDYVRFFDKVELPLDLFVVGVALAFFDDAPRWRQYLVARLEQLVRRC